MTSGMRRDDYQDIIKRQRPQSGRHGGMSDQNRAKQFLPFAALKGYEEALQQKEKQMVARAELSEEGLEELDRQLHILLDQLSRGRHPMVRAVCFQKSSGQQGEYVQVTGMAVTADLSARWLQIVDRQVSFADIRSLEFL